MAKVKAVAVSQPIAENPAVQEVAALMEANNMPGAKAFADVIGQVTAMEQHLADMVKELSTMRAELAEAQRQNHPLKNALQKAVVALQANILDLRDKLTALKRDIANGCRDLLAATREKGLSALRNIADFLKLRPALEAVRGDIDKAIRADNRAIAMIENVSAEYHKAGRAVKNIGRAVVGKEAIQEAKAPGRISKALQAPARADRRCLEAMGRCVDKAIGAVGRLEQTRHREPVMQTIEKLEAQIKQAQKVTPVRVRSRPEPAHADR